MSASLVPSREPLFAPLSDADEQTIRIAAWLDKEGYAPAARVLGVMVQRHQIVTLGEVKADPVLKAHLLASPTIMVRIYSGEHRAWWRADGAGYTTAALEAGTYTFRDAWRRTSHCDQSKSIQFEVRVPDETAPQSGWKS